MSKQIQYLNIPSYMKLWKKGKNFKAQTKKQPQNRFNYTLKLKKSTEKTNVSTPIILATLINVNIFQVV